MAAIVGAMPVAVALGDGKGFTAAFYSNVARGLGRPAGSAAGYGALVAYNAMAIALSAAFAFFAHASLRDVLHLDLPWQAWWAIGVALICEILILLVFDVAVLADKGFRGFSLSLLAERRLLRRRGHRVLYAVTSAPIKRGPPPPRVRAGSSLPQARQSSAHSPPRRWRF